MTYCSFNFEMSNEKSTEKKKNYKQRCFYFIFINIEKMFVLTFTCPPAILA